MTLNMKMMMGDLTGLQEEWDAAPSIYLEPSNEAPHPVHEASQVRVAAQLALLPTPPPAF